MERRDWKPSSLAALSTFEGTLDMRRGNILGSAGAAGNWKPPLGAAGLEPNCSPVTAGAARARATSFIVVVAVLFDDSVMWSLAKSGCDFVITVRPSAKGTRHLATRGRRLET